jgi:hypothetical protein
MDEGKICPRFGATVVRSLDLVPCCLLSVFRCGEIMAKELKKHIQDPAQYETVLNAALAAPKDYFTLCSQKPWKNGAGKPIKHCQKEPLYLSFG